MYINAPDSMKNKETKFQNQLIFIVPRSTSNISELGLMTSSDPIQCNPK